MKSTGSLRFKLDMGQGRETSDPTEFNGQDIIEGGGGGIANFPDGEVRGKAS